MRLPKPELDDLTFEKLFKEAMALIPRYVPEWTDHNLSDPGITLIDLFAWLTETSLYRLNRITEKHIQKYLQILGISPHPPKPATVNLILESSEDINIPKDAIISTVINGKQIFFELDHAITVTPLSIKKVVTDERIGIFDRTYENKEPELFFAPFGNATIKEASLYLGFDKPSETINLFIELYEDDLVTPGRHGDEPYYDFENAILVWEISTSNGWQEIEPVFDETKDFKYSGRITFKLVNSWAKKTLPFFTADGYELYWLKCRLKESQFEYPPRIRTIWLNTVSATHGMTIREMETFIGTGLPDQMYKLKYSPVLNGTVELYIENEKWEERQDLYGSGPQDKHFCIASEESTIIFGDGLRGVVPPDGVDIVVKQYRIGGGTAGNLPAGLAWNIKGYSVKAINPLAACRGEDEESIEEAKLKFLKDLKIPYRTVTSEDFEYIAKNTPGLRIARAKAFVKDKIVNVVIVPYTPFETFQKPPEPSDGMVNAVCKHIENHRLIGTFFKVLKPDYIKVSVTTNIKAKTGINVDALRKNIIKKLNIYLHPVKGGRDGKGWPPGEPVFRSEIYRLIEEIEGVKCITDVHLSGDKGAYIDQSGNLILPNENSVIYSGNHSIVFIREQERCKADG